MTKVLSLPSLEFRPGKAFIEAGGIFRVLACTFSSLFFVNISGLSTGPGSRHVRPASLRFKSKKK